MKIKTVLFDFDGTIADTVDPVVEIINEFSNSWGEKTITPEDLEKYRNLNNQDALKATGVPAYKVFFMLRKVWKEIQRRIPELECIDGIKPALQQLDKSGFQLGIVTTGIKENASKFLEANDLDMFDFIYDGKQMFGKKKALKKVLKEKNLKPEEVIYVGDQTSDIDAAKDLNIKVIAVGWGFNREPILVEHEPEYFVNKPQELVKILEDL